MKREPHVSVTPPGITGPRSQLGSNDRTWRLSFVSMYFRLKQWGIFQPVMLVFLVVQVFTGNMYTHIYPKYCKIAIKNYLWPIKTIRKTHFVELFRSASAVHEKCMHETNSATSHDVFSKRACFSCCRFPLEAFSCSRL